jgi:hypothetical protein
MRKEKVITNFDGFADVELDDAASKANTALTGNANFTFTGTVFTDFTGAATSYHSKMAALATGGRQAVIAKDIAKEILKAKFSAVAKEVNRQANGDLGKLNSSGIDLAKQPIHQQQQQPVGLQVKNGNGTDMLLSVNTGSVANHGCIFAYTPATNTDPNPNNWTIKHSNGHSITIKGLTAGTAYLFTVAYKGADDEDLVFAPPVNKIVSN